MSRDLCEVNPFPCGVPNRYGIERAKPVLHHEGAALKNRRAQQGDLKKLKSICGDYLDPNKQLYP